MTKMKKNLNYEVLVDCMHQNPQGLMEYREQVVVFRKEGINHIARIITYVDLKKNKKSKLISLLSNDFDMPLETIVAIYRRRWQIESLFKQIKQNFPLRFFTVRAPTPSRSGYGLPLLQTCCFQSCKALSKDVGASRGWPQLSE